MSLFRYDDHADNPPETWQVEAVRDHTGRAIRWRLTTKDLPEWDLDSFPTKREAEAARTSGHLVNLYEKERRWYAGEHVEGWKPFDQSVIDAQRRADAAAVAAIEQRRSELQVSA